MSNRDNGAHHSLLSSFGYFLLFFAIFVAPLATQISDFGRKFQSICGFLDNPGELAYAIVVACTVTAFFGLIIFESWRKFAWCAFMSIFALAIIKSERTRHLWPIWNSTWDYSLFQSYLLQVSLLALIPIQVWLWKRGQPVVEWAKLSLGFVAGFQASITVFQFFMLQYGHRDLLNEWGINSTTLFTPRDSTNVYREASRLTGLVTSPTLLGMILVMTWPVLLIGRSISNKHQRVRFDIAFKAIAMALVIWAIILTYTRAAYIGLGLQIIAIAILGFNDRGKTHRLSKLNLFVIAAAIASALVFIPASGARVTAITDAADASITNRLAVYNVAANLLSERPLAGWGPGFFNTLYNHFYKLPYVRYSFFDTHSATINTLMEIGVLGVILGLIAICGIHWKAVFRRTPVWVWLGALGVALPISTDNPSSSPAFMFPAIWLIGVLCVTSVSSDNCVLRLARQRCRFRSTPLWGFFATGVLLSIWIYGYSQPIKSLDQRFEETLRSTMPISTKALGFYVHDSVTGRTWAYNADKLMDGASIAKLAIAATLLSTTENNDSAVSAPLEMKNAWAKGSGILHVLPDRPTTTTVGNALYLMLSESDNSCANALFDYVGQAKISSATKALVGRQVFFEAGGFGRGVADSLKDSENEDVDEYAGAKVSARENAILLEFIMNSEGLMAEIARSALRRNVNKWGLDRYLSANWLGYTYHKSGTANGAVNHAMIYRHGNADWTASVMSSGRTNLVGVDQMTFLGLAEIGWASFLFLGGT